MIRPPPRSTLFPYTTLSRSRPALTRRTSSAPPPRHCSTAYSSPASQSTAAQPTARQPPPSKLPKLALSCQTVGITDDGDDLVGDRKSTRLNSSHANISYAVF